MTDNNHREQFVLTDGYIDMNNEKLFLDVNETKKDVRQRGGWLSVFLVFVGISVLHNLRDINYFKKVFHYFDFGLRILGGIAIIAILYYIFFMRKSKKNLIINEIKRIDIDKEELETDVTLVFNNNRKKDLEFRTLENQVEPFLKAIKKRNTRIEIKHIFNYERI